MSHIRFFSLFILAIVFCHPAGADPLPSWNDGETKKNIIDFVEKINDPTSVHFVTPEDRVAVFDNDGTLWCEKPYYIHAMAIMDRVKELIATNPGLEDLQPYKAISEKNINYFKNLFENNALNTLLGQLIAVPFGGMTNLEFENWCRHWLSSWKHPELDVGYKGLIYEPMLELLEYLKDNQFAIYIFTADEGAFLRLVSEELYGIPRDRIHGSTVRSEYIVEDDNPKLIRTFQASRLCNWDMKPRLIEQVIGKKPIFAAGNSNGDLQMLQYAALQNRPSLSLLVYHTDSDREYQYENDTDKVMKLAQKKVITIVDMKNDWKRVFTPRSLGRGSSKLEKTPSFREGLFNSDKLGGV